MYVSTTHTYHTYIHTWYIHILLYTYHTYIHIHTYIHTYIIYTYQTHTWYNYSGENFGPWFGHLTPHCWSVPWLSVHLASVTMWIPRDSHPLSYVVLDCNLLALSYNHSTHNVPFPVTIVDSCSGHNQGSSNIWYTEENSRIPYVYFHYAFSLFHLYVRWQLFKDREWGIIWPYNYLLLQCSLRAFVKIMNNMTIVSSSSWILLYNGNLWIPPRYFLYAFSLFHPNDHPQPLKDRQSRILTI